MIKKAWFLMIGFLLVWLKLVMPLRAAGLPVEPLGQPTQDRLKAALVKQSVKPLGLTNFLKHAVRAAIRNGVPANTVVLIFLLPLVGTIVSGFYYLIGLTGLGVFIPAMIAISFLATGIVGGLVLFAIILFLSILVRKFLRRIQLHQRARRAVTLWVVSLGTFGLLFLAPLFHLSDLTKISIFPVLFMVLLSEEFAKIQMGKSRKKATSLILGTLIIAIIGAVLMGWQWLQELVILNPEISLLLILFLDLFVGRYIGFRLFEYKRFKPVLRK